MTYEQLRIYKSLCNLYGWRPSLKGLTAFNRQIKAGLRDKWGRWGR